MMKTKKRPPGRPVSKDPLRKRYFRTTDAQWQEIIDASDGNAGQWIRETCAKAAKRKQNELDGDIYVARKLS